MLYTLNDDGTDIEIVVLSPRDARVPLKTSLAGKAIERAKLAAVEALLTQGYLASPSFNHRAASTAK